MRTLVWFRGKDLRVADHAPLTDAAAGGELICVFVLDPFFFASDRAAELPHRMQFLLSSLASLEKNIAHAGSKLLIVPGRSVEVIPALAEQLRVDRVFAHRWVEPFGRERDRRVAEALRVPFVLYEGETLAAPGSIRTGAQQAFSVFSPFARAFAKVAQIGAPIAAPKRLPPPPADALAIATVAVPTCAELGLPENPRVQSGGERHARERLDAFVAAAGRRYHDARDRMDVAGTSRLSADLKFGTLSVRTVWARAQATLTGDALRVFCNELIWREFAHHTLFDRPELLTRTFRADFAGFPYRQDAEGWSAWTQGKTGYPVVDASARQLLGCGFVHNRARMISASFLTKHLLIDFRLGEAHYLKWLTDGDWAQNVAGWQWSAGCGCDAQPYFRVFNPRLQGERFDPEGDYVRTWVPELAKMPAKYIHCPAEAPPEVLRSAGVVLGGSYPRPIVVHEAARARFLAAAKAHLGRP
jgi:deoxyribodipyrimidine photo-lyase